MLSFKSFKDPIYGYIEIDNHIITTVIDTPEFQRLRNIIQTSYSPLYSSAVHNRFVHSLGVYHLGKFLSLNIQKKLSDSLYKTIKQEEVARYFEIFELACLLHDVGHAPFSHTGESFYLKDGDRKELHKEIINLTKDQDLKKEISEKAGIYKAAAHELMSVIVALRVYNSLFRSNEEKSFFSRCITGYLYANKKDEKHSFLNCLVSFLNSSVIDVDKLDYLIRDAYITGFDTINIDYERLLTSINVKKIENKYEVIFMKGAISVIENVVYAHDAERKWIQNHPIVQYEGYLLKNIIGALNRKYAGKRLFSHSALTRQGIVLSKNYSVCLLCDADIIFLLKNLKDNEEVIELFDRNRRRHPIWKSESEYKALFDTCFNDQTYNVLDAEMDDLFKYLNYLNSAQTINDKTLKSCEEDIASYEEIFQSGGTDSSLEEQIIRKHRFKDWIMAFKEFAEQQEIEFDFVILKQDQFNSGFAKDKFSKLKIKFQELENVCLFENVTNVLTAKKSLREKFFYVFYRRNQDTEKDLDAFKLINALNELAKQKTMK